jgi:hypothetical protein
MKTNVLPSKDPLLLFGNVLALILQGVCALAGGLFFLLIPIVILLSQDMLTGFVDANDIPMIIEKSPLSVVGIALLIAVSLAALFSFFGKMRAIIRSVGEGDPFNPENARRLNAMAWLLLVHEVVAVLVGGLRVYLANLVDEQGGNKIDFNLYDLDGILMIITLFILARVFRHGAAMRDDLEGTV